MHEQAKFVCFIYMQPRKMKFKFVQINMKQVSYIHFFLKCLLLHQVNVLAHLLCHATYFTALNKCCDLVKPENLSFFII